MVSANTYIHQYMLVTFQFKEQCFLAHQIWISSVYSCVIILSYTPVPTCGNDKNRTAAHRKTSGVIVMLKWRHHAMSRLSVLGIYVHANLYFNYENPLFNDEQEKYRIFLSWMIPILRTIKDHVTPNSATRNDAPLSAYERVFETTPTMIRSASTETTSQNYCWWVR